MTGVSWHPECMLPAKVMRRNICQACSAGCSGHARSQQRRRQTARIAHMHAKSLLACPSQTLRNRRHWGLRRASERCRLGFADFLALQSPKQPVRLPQWPCTCAKQQATRQFAFRHDNDERMSAAPGRGPKKQSGELAFLLLAHSASIVCMGDLCQLDENPLA